MSDVVRYRDRDEAGRVLAEALRDSDVSPEPLVLALPRGGVPVGREVAMRWVRSWTWCWYGSWATRVSRSWRWARSRRGGGRSVNERVASEVSREAFEGVEREEREELARRERVFRGDRAEPRVTGRCVVLVDDGVATGSTMKAAAEALRSVGPAKIVIAVPVAPPESIAELRAVADEVVCPSTPAGFRSIGQFYGDFAQLDDERVQSLLGGRDRPATP